MGKKKTIISETLLAEIRQYLLDNPTVSMETASKHFHMGRKLFYRVTHKELDMWNPLAKNPRRWPKNLNKLIKESFADNPKTIKDAYGIFLTKYDQTSFISFNTFRYFGDKLDLLKNVPPKVVRFPQTDFEKIFRNYDDESLKGEEKPGNQELRRGFSRFLKEIPKNETLFRLDPNLPQEHQFFYRKVGKKMCWSCGKTEHFELPVFLEIDHISGNALDHRLSNLRLLCPCCHRMAITTNRRITTTKTKFDLYDHLHPKVNVTKLKEARQQTLKRLGLEIES